MKKGRLFMLVAMIATMLFGAVSVDAQYTNAQGVYGASGGISYKAFDEALRRNALSIGGSGYGTITMKAGDIIYEPSASSGQFTFTEYKGTGEADGTGSFAIDLDIPSGSILVYAKFRVDVAITATTGVSWSGSFSGGSTETIVAAQAFPQNTKASAFFDVNGATAVLTDTTDIAITPDAGTLDTGFITASVGVYVIDSLPDTKAITFSGLTFTEAGGNDGSTTTALTLTASGFTYAHDVGDDLLNLGYATAANVPVGLTAVLTKTSNTVLTLTLTGTATDHDDADDVADMEISIGDRCIADGVLSSDIVNVARTDLAVDFSD